MFPKVLATIDGSSDAERLVLSLVECELNGTGLQLERQTWSESLGWFTQSRVRVARDEVNGLRSALGSVSTPRRPLNRLEAPAILQFPAQHSA